MKITHFKEAEPVPERRLQISHFEESDDSKPEPEKKEIEKEYPEKGLPTSYLGRQGKPKRKVLK